MQLAEIRAEPFIRAFSTRAKFTPNQYERGLHRAKLIVEVEVGRFTCSRKKKKIRRCSVGVTLQKNNVRRDRLITPLPRSVTLWVSWGGGKMILFFFKDI